MGSLLLGEQGCFLAGVPGPLSAAAPLVDAQALERRSVAVMQGCSCLCGRQGLLGSGLELVPPASAGGFLLSHQGSPESEVLEGQL